MKIIVRSEILDFRKFDSGSKGRHILLNSVLWVMQLVKTMDISEESPYWNVDFGPTLVLFNFC
jgi:hypothetical protein